MVNTNCILLEQNLMAYQPNKKSNTKISITNREWVW